MLPFITIPIIHFNFARTAHKYNTHTQPTIRFAYEKCARLNNSVMAKSNQLIIKLLFALCECSIPWMGVCVCVCMRARICALTRFSYYVCWLLASDHHKRLRAIIFLWHFPIVVHNMSRMWRFMCGAVSIQSSYCTADEDMPLHIERSATTPRHFTFIRLRTDIDSTLTWNANLID